MLSSILIFFVLGVVGNFIAGLFGAGASLIFLPVLLFYFAHVAHLPFAIQTAAGTTIASALIAACVGAFKHYKSGNYEKDLLITLAPVYLVGGLIGAYIAHIML